MSQATTNAAPAAAQEREDALVAVIESNASQKEKVDACRRLAVVGTKSCVPALAALLTDEKLSHMARYGLETIPDPAVDDALRDALGKVKGRLLVGVIASVGVRRDARAVEPLSGLLGSSDADVAAAAARALGRMAAPETVPLLAETLKEAPARLRPAMADACLACAEALLARRKRTEAAAMYEIVGKADLPKHFRVAAAYGALRAKSEDLP
ncbi:MAG: HEAT repeat domain-containing protein [Planctomycetota bacterium]|jgi:HEAT repeat protein